MELVEVSSPSFLTSTPFSPSLRLFFSPSSPSLALLLSLFIYLFLFSFAVVVQRGSLLASDCDVVIHCCNCFHKVKRREREREREEKRRDRGDIEEEEEREVHISNE